MENVSFSTATQKAFTSISITQRFSSTEMFCSELIQQMAEFGTGNEKAVPPDLLVVS